MPDADDARRRCVEWGRFRRLMLLMLSGVVWNGEGGGGSGG